MSTEWKPPAFGTPVWMGIPANDVGRASKFYETVFNFSFKKEQPANYPMDQCKMFDLNPSLSLHGGIQKAPDSTGLFKPGRGGICIYWLVKNVDEIAPVVEEAGGKMLSEKQKEGDYGEFRYFEDTEGTVGAVYHMVACQ
ncbi:Fc.00g097510.m01.CDS01 [Cosmosporella sp. VM-42]